MEFGVKECSCLDLPLTLQGEAEMQHVVCVKVMDMCLDQNRNSVSRTIALSIYGRVGGVGVDVGVGVVDGIDGSLGVVLRVVLAWC